MGASRPVPDDLVGRLHRQTGGNPLALLEASAEMDRFRRGAPLDTPLPLVTSVSDVYLRRIRALPSPHCASCSWPRPTTAKTFLLSPGPHPSSASTWATSMRLRTRGSWVPAMVRCYFRHPLVRSAVYNDASHEARRAVHRALADALPDAEVDRRAWHLALSVLGPDEAACSALEQAGGRARDRSAYDVSSRAFERAAQLAPDDQWRGRLLYGAADAAWLGRPGPSGAGPPGRRGQGSALTPELEASVDTLRGHIAARVGRVADGQAILSRGAERVAARRPRPSRCHVGRGSQCRFFCREPHGHARCRGTDRRIGPSRQGAIDIFFASMARGMALTFCGESERRRAFA